MSRLGFEDKEWKKNTIASLTQWWVRPQYFVHLFSDGGIILELTFGFVKK
jgi:hypothetical protein